MSLLGAVLLAQAATSAGGVVAVEGRAVRAVAHDTVAAAGTRVVLHRVGAARQGVVDSLTVGADGRFAFRSTIDSGEVLLVSGRWHGVEYFAQPVVPGVAVELLVVDTSSSAPVSVVARHVIIGGPAPDGARDVVDLVVLRNRGTRTRVGGGEAAPSFRMPLPPHVANVTVGDADFAADAFDVHDDTLGLMAPIPPGDRQFFLQYQLVPGARTLDLPLEPPPDTLSVLAEEAGLDMPTTLVAQGTEQVAGRSFSRWSGRPDGTIRIGLQGTADAPGWLLPGLLVVVAVPLLLVTRRALLPRPIG
jgi:hypothetical protein